MININFDLNTLNSEELYALQIKITNTLRERSRLNATAPVVAESQTVSEAVSEVKSAAKGGTDPFGAVIRDGKTVYTAARFISKGQRYAIRMAVKSAGGQQVHEGAVYDSLKANDKFVEVFEFKTIKAARAFMADQRAYFEAHKKG